MLALDRSSELTRSAVIALCFERSLLQKTYFVVKKWFSGITVAKLCRCNQKLLLDGKEYFFFDVHGTTFFEAKLNHIRDSVITTTSDRASTGTCFFSEKQN